MRTRLAVALLAVSALAGGGVVFHHPVHAQDAAQQGTVAEGKRVFQKANCIGCHKWHGAGGGGYGGDALSLRATQLDRDQIIQTVTCGRPSTGMPYFHRGAYDESDHPCNGITREDLGKDMPIEANVFLRPAEIAAVTDYILADVKGKGEPTYAECAAFFGDNARVCNIYKENAAQPGKQGG